ncbi:hypothetical protein [Streptomyces sp. TRM70350]|uniref:hypothetical protein n=1 Tax=Streptomyces sp. TRM70350 TaxID=2856165 RepID=UPI0021108E21|nr:hypothetical protein [Streptomyces sp. TRM70350]
MRVRLPAEQLLLGAAVCAAATALCAVAPDLGVLIVLRFVTGFSGAAGLVVGRAVVSDVATGPVAAKLFGVLMALGGIAPIVAPWPVVPSPATRAAGAASSGCWRASRS